jgi:uncharacterized membrane protein YfcA
VDHLRTGSAWASDPAARHAVVAGCVAALVGSIVGARLIRKVTIGAVRVAVGVALLLLGAALAAGLL